MWFHVGRIPTNRAVRNMLAGRGAKNSHGSMRWSIRGRRMDGRPGYATFQGIPFGTVSTAQTARDRPEERTMTKRTTTVFASLALLASTAAASAAGFGGVFAAPGTTRVTNWVNQASTVASLQTIPIKVQMCNGAVEAPVFVAAGAGSVIAAGSCYQVTATIIAANQTQFSIVHTGGANGIKTISFGTVNTHSAFDRTMPAPGTPGSMSGQDVVPMLMAGAWNVNCGYSDIVKLGAAPPVGDLYCRLTLYFSSCFDVGDVFTFRADTDQIN